MSHLGDEIPFTDDELDLWADGIPRARGHGMIDDLTELAGGGSTAASTAKAFRKKLATGTWFNELKSERALRMLGGLDPKMKVPGMLGRAGAGVEVGDLLSKAKWLRAGGWAARGLGLGFAALTAADLAKLAYDAGYGWEKQGKLNRMEDAYQRMDEDELAFALTGRKHDADMMEGALSMSQAVARGTQRVADSEESKLQEALVPMQASLAAHAYREQPSLAETLAKMGYEID